MGEIDAAAQVCTAGDKCLEDGDRAIIEDMFICSLS
jgi:hypothetical protein